LSRCAAQTASVCAALQSGPSYVEAFLTVLKNVTKDETVQYVLAMVEEMLAGALVLEGEASVSLGSSFSNV
jgi:hypothetical protein